jgi:hypothetical protein
MLERESDLHLQAPVIGIFRETNASTTATASSPGSSATASSPGSRSKAATCGHLVRLSEER